MTTTELQKKLKLSLLTEDNGREIKGGYCGDLLSRVMAGAPADSAWITVMGNVNAVAVASLTDVACIILAEGAPFDEEARVKALEREICVFASELSMFELCNRIL